MLSTGIKDIDSDQDTHACFVPAGISDICIVPGACECIDYVWLLLDFRFRCWKVVHECLRLVDCP